MEKYLLRALLKKYWKLVAAMTLVSILGISPLVGLSGAYSTLEKSIDTYIEDYRLADAFILTELTDSETASQLAAIPGVNQVNTRLIADSLIRTPSGRVASIRGISYGIRDFQSFYVWDICESTDYPNIALDRQFAKRNGIQAGDLIEVRLEDDYETMCVGTIVSAPECLSMQADIYSLGENPDFGFLFFPKEFAYESEYYTQTNQYLLRFDSWADGQAILEQAAAILGDAQLSSYLYEDSGVSYRVEINMDPLEQLTILIPILFYFTMIAVVTLFLAQIIHQSRRDIGILRALGFEKSRIRTIFCLLTLVVTTVACALGIGVGYALAVLVGGAFANSFPLPHVFPTLNSGLCLLAIVLTTLAGQLCAWFSTASIASIQPSEAMSRQSTGSVQIGAFLSKVLSRLSPAMKFCTVSMLRNRRRFLFSVICIASSTMLILCAVAFSVAKDDVLKQLFAERIHYDCQIFFREAPGDDIISAITNTPGVSQVQPLNFYSREVTCGDYTETLLLASCQPDSELINLPGMGKSNAVIPDSGILLESHMAKELNAQAGSVILADGSPLTVSGLSDQRIYWISYLSPAQSSVLGEPDQYTILCNVQDEDALLAVLADCSTFSHADFTDRIRAGLQQVFATYDIGVCLLIGFAVALGITIVFNTTQTNLLEQKKAVSVMRAIGFQVSDISNIWLLQSAVQFLLACAIGMPAGKQVASIAMARITTAGREYRFSESPGQFLVTAALVLIYLLVSHYAAIGVIRRWDISENTKEKE